MIIARKHSRVNASDDKFIIFDGIASKSTDAVRSSNIDIQLPVLSLNSDGTNINYISDESIDYLISIPDFEHSSVKISSTYYETNSAFINVLNNTASLPTPKHSFVVQAPCTTLYAQYTFDETDVVRTEVYIASKENQDFLVFRVYKNNEFLAQYPSDNPTHPTETLEMTKPIIVIIGTKLNGTSENVGFKIASYHYGGYEIACGNNDNNKKTFGYYANSSIERGKIPESGSFYSLIPHKMTLWNPAYPIITNNMADIEADFENVNGRISQVDEGLHGSFLAG